MSSPHRDPGFFTETLAARDPAIATVMVQELGAIITA